jgi:hypothetical protein
MTKKPPTPPTIHGSRGIEAPAPCSNLFVLQNKKDGMFLNADGDNIKNGCKIQIYTRTGGANEVWLVVAP